MDFDMKIGQKGLDLIREFEGCRLTAYQDSVGVWTVGIGSTGPDVCKGLTITQDEAEERLRKHLEGVEDAITRAVQVPITQNEFDALCCLAYNIGTGAMLKSTLLKMLNEARYDDAAAQFLRWDKAGGQVLAGLTRRRIAEKTLFESA